MAVVRLKVGHTAPLTEGVVAICDKAKRAPAEAAAPLAPEYVVEAMQLTALRVSEAKIDTRRFDIAACSAKGAMWS